MTGANYIMSSNQPHLVISAVFLFLVAFQISSARSPTNALKNVCDRKWELIYAHDVYGNSTFGSKKELLELAMRGNYVKASLYMPDHILQLPADSISKYKQSLCFQSLRALSHNGTHIDDTAPWLYFMICSTGHVTERSVSNTSTYRVAMDWYIKDISFDPDPIYSSFIDGTPTNPKNLVKLQEAAKRMNLFGAMRDRPYVFPLNNVILDPETGEVNGQNVMHLGQRYQDDHVTFHNVAYRWFSFWSSFGTRDNARWSLQNHIAYNHNADSATLDWYCDVCWRHIYTNDGNGFDIFGTIEELIDKVEKGHRVRVRVDDVAMEVSNLRVNNGVVAAQLLQEVTRVGGSLKDRYYIESDTRVKFSIVHTTGKVASYEYLVGSPIRKVNPPVRKIIEWMVDTRPWRVVMQTIDPPGQVLKGSFFDLRDAVMGGASIRLNVQLDPLAGSFFTSVNNVRVDILTDEVYVQATDHMSDQKSRVRDEYELQKSLFQWYLLISSEGAVRMSAWTFGLDTFRYDEGAPEATVTWFVNL